MEQLTRIRVLIADDHDLFRDGLSLLLMNEPTVELVGDAANGKQLVKLAKELNPDIILTDLKMPEIDGIEAIKILKQNDPDIKIITLSSFDSDAMVIDALEAGAMGYIIKNAERGEIIDAIKMVYTGSPYYCKTTSGRLVKLIVRSEFNPYKVDASKLFSDKEKEIIRLICEEKTSKEIGELLFMSSRTVEGHRVKILEKMNVKTTAGIAIYAIKNGIYKAYQE
ncbi:MAG: response regulator transcription factor [Chitinophagaceae bacterium]|nr:response regulator transcription factor [Chitinophagaceae bacterium]